MREGDCEKPLCLRRCVTSMVAMVISATILHPGYTFARGVQKATLPDIRVDSSIRTLLEGVDSIVKDTVTVTYPPEDFYRIVQDKIPKSTPFPCHVKEDRPMKRSEKRPTSVHQLRPGDIDVIAAMGDSITSANSARERSSWGLLISDRGVSFLGGGLSTWHEITTLPNIIKMYNPNLVGQALGRGDFYSYNAQLNVAIPGSLDEDLMNQVRIFIEKMKRDKRIDYQNDWKLLSMFVGHNDLCSKQCWQKEISSAAAHKLHLQKGLDYLYQHVPRLFINFIPVLDPSIQVRFTDRNLPCEFLSRIGCNCLHRNETTEEGTADLSSAAKRYQQVQKELVFSGRYDGREDFTVEFQPFTMILNAPDNPYDPENANLMKYLRDEPPIWSPDCFHFNQRGLAEMSIQIWNNMLEPVGNKSSNYDDITIKQYKCPTKSNPYFFTKKNSENFFNQGHQ